MNRILVGIALAIGLTLPARAAELHERVVGSWKVKFDNGVEQLSVIAMDKTASVWEPLRQSAGKVEIRDDRVTVLFADDRLERWTPVGKRAVVEHWAKSADYATKLPVSGIAEVNHDGQRDEIRPKTSSRRDANMMLIAKTFVDAMRPNRAAESAATQRACIDPRYLKEHHLEDGDLPLRRVTTGAILTKSMVDETTVFLIVETNEAEKEIWLLRMTEVDGKTYIVPPRPPHPRTKSVTAWSFRWKL